MDMSHMPNMDDGMRNMTMKAMSFHWDYYAIVLFSGWPDHSLSKYILALFLVFFMAVATEILSIPAAFHTPVGTVPIVAAFSRACVYGLRVGLSYLVMLSVMSFNVGILIVAIAGHAIGFFIVKVRAFKRSNKEDDEESYM